MLRKHMNRTLLGFLACLLLVAGAVMGMVAIAANQRANSIASGAVAVVDPDVAKDKTVEESGWLKAYTLTERSGKKFHSEDLKGKVHVVNFFFATCPTVCRLQTGA